MCVLFGANSLTFAAGNFLADDVKPSAMLNVSLVIKANLYYGDEDEEAAPLRETTVYLLDASLVDILKESGFQPESDDGTDHLSGDSDYLNATAAALFSEDENSLIVNLMIRKSLARHQIYQKKTDTAGLTHFKSLQAGSYYLFAASKKEDEIFLWNLPVTLKAGNNLVEIDQHNSEIIDSFDD